MRSYRTHVYKMTFPNGKVYIGSTGNIKERWSGKGIKYRGMKVYEAIQEFGWDSIKREIIISLPESYKNDGVIRKVEMELIKAYNGKSYNCMGDPTFHEENETWLSRNRKPIKYWTAFGETKPMTEWCEEFHKSPSQIAKRIERHGLTLEQALTFPPIPRTQRKSQNGAIEYWKSLGLFETEPSREKRPEGQYIVVGSNN